MQENPFTFLGQAISQLLSSHSAALQASGLNMFRGLAVILIAWFGIKVALSASQGHGGFHFAKFADLILLISFGLGMLTYYSTPTILSTAELGCLDANAVRTVDGCHGGDHVYRLDL